MNPHVTSKELSERLKKLGVKQNALHNWVPDSDGKTIHLYASSPFLKVKGKKIVKWLNYTSAFLASELGEMLPSWFVKNGEQYEILIAKVPDITKDTEEWWVYSVNIDKEEKKNNGMNAQHPNLAEAMGLMLEYLLINKLITL